MQLRRGSIQCKNQCHFNIRNTCTSFVIWIDIWENLSINHTDGYSVWDNQHSSHSSKAILKSNRMDRDTWNYGIRYDIMNPNWKYYSHSSWRFHTRKIHCCHPKALHILQLFTAIRFNSSSPSATYMDRWTGAALVQVMDWRRIGAKPLPEPMFIYCQLDL